MDKKYKIGIIGAGKIAYSLTPALIKAGYKVVSISSLKISSAGTLAKKNNVKNFSNTAESTVALCDLIFISVPDSQIEVTAGEIAKLKEIKGKTVVHLSGTKNIRALKALKNKGINIAGLHLIQAFPERKPVSIKNCYASIEASDKKTEQSVKKIAEAIGAFPFVISSEEKILLHIMCVFTANFMNADYYNANLLYKKIKSKMPPIEKLLFPLSSANLNNIKNKGIEKSLSGPLARKDYDTVNEHLEKLFDLSGKDVRFNDVLDSYAIQTMNLLLMTRKGKQNKPNKK